MGTGERESVCVCGGGGGGCMCDSIRSGYVGGQLVKTCNILSFSFFTIIQLAHHPSSMLSSCLECNSGLIFSFLPDPHRKLGQLSALLKPSKNFC